MHKLAGFEGSQEPACTLLVQLQGINAGFADGITTGVEQVCTVSVEWVKHAPAASVVAV
jgi:hypothetical protein